MWSTLTPMEVGGKIPQVEYAEMCVCRSEPAVAVKTDKFCVMATVKTFPPLADSDTIRKIVPLNINAGLTYAGLDSDFRVVANSLFKYSLLSLFDNIKNSARKVSDAFQEYAHSCATRPFGLTLILSGYTIWDNLSLYKIDTCGNKGLCNIAAVGIGAVGRNEYLVEEYKEKMNLRSALLMTLESLTLDPCEKLLKPENFEIAVCDRNGFKLFDKASIEYMVDHVV